MTPSLFDYHWASASGVFHLSNISQLEFLIAYYSMQWGLLVFQAFLYDLVTPRSGYNQASASREQLSCKETLENPWFDFSLCQGLSETGAIKS